MRPPTRSRRRGLSIFYVLLSMTALVGVCSLAVDYGRVQLAKTELRNAADAACRAAVLGFNTSVAKAQNDAVAVAASNTCDGKPVSINTSDVEFGNWDDIHKSFTPLTGAAQATATAIRVTAARTAARGNPIPLLFAKMIGKSSCDLTALCISHSSTTGFSIVGLNSLSILRGVGGSSGQSPRIDSWNFAAGPYASYPMNSNGNCATNGTLTLSTGVSVRGACRPGKGKTIVGTGYTITGASAPMTYTLQYPAPTPGSYATNNNNANLIALGGTYFNKVTRDFTLPSRTFTIPGGVYYVNHINWNTAHITFTGPVVFYITGTDSGTTKGFNGHNNYITTYQNLPKNLKFEVCNACTVIYDFDQACNAILYAPLANVTTTGLADDYGSVVGGNLTMGVGWHVDESLSGAGVMGYISMIQ